MERTTLLCCLGDDKENLKNLVITADLSNYMGQKRSNFQYVFHEVLNYLNKSTSLKCYPVHFFYFFSKIFFSFFLEHPVNLSCRTVLLD